MTSPLLKTLFVGIPAATLLATCGGGGGGKDGEELAALFCHLVQASRANSTILRSMSAFFVLHSYPVAFCLRQTAYTVSAIKKNRAGKST